MASRKLIGIVVNTIRIPVIRPLAKMPPKQGTLKYVKDSQTSLACVASRVAAFHCCIQISLTYGASSSKFFSQPNGTRAKPPAKQSTLSFSSKSGTINGTPCSSASKENEDVESKDEGFDMEIKPYVKKEDDLEMKENLKPENSTV